MNLPRSISALAALLALSVAHAALSQQPAATAPLIKRGATMKISEHAYVILDDNVGFVPNVGIVVGERATLIVDTGMGPDNGAIVLEEARKLSDNTEFYLTATHFHPEHDLGATAFPASAKMIRWRGQQAEIDARVEPLRPLVRQLHAELQVTQRGDEVGRGAVVAVRRRAVGDEDLAPLEGLEARREGDVRDDPRGARVHRGGRAALLLGQGPGLPLQQVPGGRRAARAGDAVDG